MWGLEIDFECTLDFYLHFQDFAITRTLCILRRGSTNYTFYTIRCWSVVVRICKSIAIFLSVIPFYSVYVASEINVLLCNSLPEWTNTASVVLNRKVSVYWNFWISSSVIHCLFAIITPWRREGFPVFHWRLFLIGQLCGKLDQLYEIINIFQLPLRFQVIVLLISGLPRRPLDFSNVNFFQTANVIIEKKKKNK